MIWATFVHGYDNDDAASINSTMQFAIKNNLAVANFNPLIPMPDTPLYKRLESNNKLIFKKWWLEKDYRYGDTVFYPEKMTPEELKQGCKNARFIFNSYKSIIKRLLGAKVNRKNALLFLAINIISRKEIHRKQGKIIGGKDK